MTYEMLKLLVQPVIVQKDDEGRIVGELPVENVVSLYTDEQLTEFLANLRTQLAEMSAQATEVERRTPEE